MHPISAGCFSKKFLEGQEFKNKHTSDCYPQNWLIEFYCDNIMYRYLAPTQNTKHFSPHFFQKYNALISVNSHWFCSFRRKKIQNNEFTTFRPRNNQQLTIKTE